MMTGLTSLQAGEEKRPAETKEESARPVFTTTVDWYKPPPKRFDSTRSVPLPPQLFEAVPARLVEEASALLGNADNIPLTKEQVARFSSTIDPDPILQARIQERTEKLRFFRSNPVNELEIMTSYGKRELEEQKQRHQSIINDAASEIRHLRQWEHRLKPYLIKAVALQAGGSFGGGLVSEDLIISFTAMGSLAAPMVRRPVVVFLPKKPRRVFTGVAMVE